MLIVSIDAEDVVGLVAEIGGARDVLQGDAPLPAVDHHLHLAGMRHEEDQQVVLDGEVAQCPDHVAIPGVLRPLGRTG